VTELACKTCGKAVSASLLNVECPPGWWLGYMQMAAAILAKRPRGYCRGISVNRCSAAPDAAQSAQIATKDRVYTQCSENFAGRSQWRLIGR
jgi:hypothetical protein